jgi:hypothetical protein
MFSAQCHTPNEISKDEATASHGSRPAAFKKPARGDPRTAFLIGKGKTLPAALMN